MKLLEEIEKGQWLTDSKQVKDAEIRSLLRSIITPDGRGRELKLTVLCELMKRADVDCEHLLFSLIVDSDDTRLLDHENKNHLHSR